MVENMTDSFVFVPPPEAPVFYPSLEEFKDPLAYLTKIRHIGMKTGICKIIPPKTWSPPFAVNMKEFKFTPRIQRLYELEALSRIKLNFISKLYKFVRLQGGDKIRVPSIGGRYLDLYALHKHVAEAGGYQHICDGHLWPLIAERLGYQSRHAHSIKVNYEKLLLSFDQTILGQPLASKNVKRNEDRIVSMKRQRYPSVQDKQIDYSVSKELRNLQFYGAGPKAAVPMCELTKDSSQGANNHKSVDEFLCQVCQRGDDENNLLVCDNDSCQACYHLYCLNPPLRSIPKCHWKCPQCIRSICLDPIESYGFPQSSKIYSLHEFGVMADEFKAAYFKRPCTEVPYSEVEQEFWRILQEYNDDVVVEYGADIHSSDHGSGFPTESRLNSLVGTVSQLAEAKIYADSPWNLNILPLLDRSVLRFIKGNIDGMKIPWCYVGMVFSSFCWHIEDHWSYSINFNHWGEPKTWYGVSRLHAEDFERAMRKHAGELFERDPDLLHHITTNMNPNLLQAEGVPIYRTDQQCGEFVVTFPRAYHAGFNQGFNFAEAVNICLPDWLPIGRACIEHYAEMKRHCVFSNDELLCTLTEVAVGNVQPEDILVVTNPVTIISNHQHQLDKSDTRNRLPPGCSSKGLDIDAIAIVHQEFNVLLKNEQKFRELVNQLGIHKSEKVKFDEMADDARVCDVCLTTLFLSGVCCPCSNPPQPVIDLSCDSGDDQIMTPVSANTRKRKNSERNMGPPVLNESNEEKERVPSHMVCLKHVEDLCEKCSVSTFVLKYHYTIEELIKLEQRLAERLTNFYTWRNQLIFLMKSIKSDHDYSHTYDNQSNAFIKKEADDCEDSSSCLPKQNDLNSNSMTINELETKLIEGQNAGYHTDEIFLEAKTLLERGQHLCQICARLNVVIMGSQDSSNQNTSTSTSSSQEFVRFPFRRPATFTVSSPINSTTSTTTNTISTTKVALKPTSNRGFVVLNHEFDINNPRETDLIRLIEACEQQYPLDLSANPDVQRIKHLLLTLTEWRSHIFDTVSILCHLILTNATRSITNISKNNQNSSESTLYNLDLKTLDKNLNHLTTDEQALIVLNRLLENLRSEFPLYVHRLPEWNLLNLLRQSIKWLCVYERYDNQSKCIYWSLPNLRQYLIYGEEIIARLTANSTNSKSQSNLNCLSTSLTRINQSMNISNINVNNTNLSNIEIAIVPIIRLLRARMHTCLGQLTQLSVKTESLISLITELLANLNEQSSSYLEIQNILGQFQTLRINHFSIQSITDSNCINEPELNSILKEESLFGLMDNHTEPSMDDVLHLKQLFEQHIDSLLNNCSRNNVNCMNKNQLKLTEVEVLSDLGALLCSQSSLITSTNKFSDNDISVNLCSSVVFNNLNILDSQYLKLCNLLSATKSAVHDLELKFIPDDLSKNKLFTGSLTEIFLPVFPTKLQTEQAITEFNEAYSKSPEEALITYDRLCAASEDHILNLVKSFLANGNNCEICASRLKISNFSPQLTESGTSTSQCFICQLISASPSYPTFDWLIRFQSNWTKDSLINESEFSNLINSETVDLTDDDKKVTNLSNMILLTTLESVAVFGFLRRIPRWLNKLEHLLQTNQDIVIKLLSKVDEKIIKHLPKSLISLIKQYSIEINDNDDTNSNNIDNSDNNADNYIDSINYCHSSDLINSELIQSLINLYFTSLSFKISINPFVLKFIKSLISLV